MKFELNRFGMSGRSSMNKLQSSKVLSDGGEIEVIVVSRNTHSLFFIAIAIQNVGF